MILSGKEILKEFKGGRIHINPFVVENIGTNSYDFRLGEKLRFYSKPVLDTKAFNEFEEIVIPEDGFLLEPDKVYLGHSMEEMGSDNYTPLIQAKSSFGRLGLSVCLNSGLGDIGYKNQWTLLLYSPQPLKVYKGEKIGQIYFLETRGKLDLYKGAYANSSGPMASTLWQQFAKRK